MKKVLSIFPIILLLGSCGGEGEAPTLITIPSSVTPPSPPSPSPPPTFQVSYTVSPKLDLANGSLTSAQMLAGLSFAPSGVIFSQGLDRRERVTIFPTLFFKDPQLPGFELLQGSDQKYTLNGFTPITMGTPRAWAQLDTKNSQKRQYVVVDHGSEFETGYESWPFGHVWTMTDRGSGFKFSQVTSVKAFYHSTATADMNRDGLDDILASNMGIKSGGVASSIHLFLQKPDGSFVQDTKFASGFDVGETGAIASIDLDGDNVPEVIQANYLINQPSNDWGALRIISMGAGGNYSEKSKLSRQGLFNTMGATQVTPGDFDGDGDQDLFISLEGQAPNNTATRYNANGLELYRNDGNLKFTRITDTSFAKNYWSFSELQFREFSLSDFNNDGIIDIFLNLWTGEYFDGNKINIGKGILINNAKGQFVDASTTPTLQFSLLNSNGASLTPAYLRFSGKTANANNLFGVTKDGFPFQIRVSYGN